MPRFPLVLCALALLGGTPVQEQAKRPNILWITCEDMSPNLGCYGDAYAVTPHIDKLASQGVRYTNAFAPIGVCAPSRSTIITGMYPPSIGTQHMRCRGDLPPAVKCFPEYLRGAGYYCTNNSKTDYNFQHPKSAWDESSGKAHWRGRKPGQPFFAVINFVSTHESQVRLADGARQKRNATLSENERHDPAKAPIPPYHPDAPEVRRDWAHYYDNISFMDREVAGVLKELEEEKLADDTIVFFYSDHGAGMPRSKRWLYDSSTRVPLILRFPENWKHLAPGEPGTSTDRLVSFVDLAPTVLSLAGIKPPEHLQGVAFLGVHEGGPRKHVFGFRDRMDERIDMVRSVRDKRFKYIRNFMPHLPWAQNISYMYQMPTMKVWQRLFDEGKLNPVQRRFFEPKPVEELYDTVADPHEVNNLATDRRQQAVLEALRTRLIGWMAETLDLGLLPEAELRSRFGGKPEHDAARSSPALYPMTRLWEAAEAAALRDPLGAGRLASLLGDTDPATRFWGATGCAALGEAAAPAAEALTKALGDPTACVRVAAADALAKLGKVDLALPILAKALKDPNEWARLQAINAIDALGAQAQPIAAEVREAGKDSNEYVKRVVAHVLDRLK